MMTARLLLMSVLGVTLLAATGYAAQQEIDQANQTFSVKEVSLQVGDSLEFQNHDDVSHNINVIDGDGNVDDQGIQKPGEKISKLFDKAGKFQIRCAIHPRMKMSVEVN